MHRAATAHAAADALEALAAAGPFRPALVGFDGFIDAIIDAVDTRHAMTSDGYRPLATITAFAERVGAAAGKSTNIELVVKEKRFGGNGPLLASGVARLGMPTTYVGAVGRAESPRDLHPVYAAFAARCREVIPVAPPASTDAIEFSDGKIMLGKPANVQSITWPMLLATLGLPRLRKLVNDASLIGIVNWVMMVGVESIWQGLCEDVFSYITEPRAKRIYIDLADPAKRTDEDIRRCAVLLARMDRAVPLTLGLNLSEAERVSSVHGLRLDSGGSGSLADRLPRLAADLRGVLGLSCVVIHPREGAAAADVTGSAWFDGPFTATPKLSTGAGDHFNSGFAAAQVHRLPLEQCLAVGCAVSGAYVRDAESPGLTRVTGFLRNLPSPESAG